MNQANETLLRQIKQAYMAWRDVQVPPYHSRSPHTCGVLIGSRPEDCDCTCGKYPSLGVEVGNLLTFGNGRAGQIDRRRRPGQARIAKKPRAVVIASEVYDRPKPRLPKASTRGPHRASCGLAYFDTPAGGIWPADRAGCVESVRHRRAGLVTSWVLTAYPSCG